MHGLALAWRQECQQLWDREPQVAATLQAGSTQRQARGLLPVGFGLLRASVEAERGETESNGQERLHADTDLCHPTKRCCMCFLSTSAQTPQRRELPPAKQRTLSVCMGSRGHWCALWGLLLRESGALAEKMQGGNEGELNSGEA